MKPQDGLDLKALVNATATEMRQERRASVQGLIKVMLERRLSLERDCESHRKALTKSEDALTKIDEKLQKLRDGDWSVLPEQGKDKDKGEN